LSANKTSYRPGGGETMAPPMEVFLTRGGTTSVRGPVRSPHIAKLQAASVPIAQGSCALTAGTDRRTDHGIVLCSSTAGDKNKLIDPRQRYLILFKSYRPSTRTHTDTCTADKLRYSDHCSVTTIYLLMHTDVVAMSNVST